MKSTTTEFLNCHHCSAAESVEFKMISSKKYIDYKVGKCSECKEQNYIKSIMKHNKIFGEG